MPKRIITTIDSKKRQRYIISVIVGVGILLFVAALLSSRGSKETTDYRVAATIFPVYDIVRAIGGDEVRADLLLPVGANLSAADQIYSQPEAHQAQIIFNIGHGLDDTGIPAELRSKLYPVDSGVDLLLEQNSTGNPYYWLSPKNGLLMVDNISRRLAQMDPAHADVFRSRAEQIKLQLQQVDASIQSVLHQPVTNKMAVYGDDWAYFARDYGLDIVQYQPVVSGEALSGDVLNDFRNAITEYDLTGVYAPVGVSPAPLLPLVQENNIRILGLDPLGGSDTSSSYIGMLLTNAQTIAEGQGALLQQATGGN